MKKVKLLVVILSVIFVSFMATGCSRTCSCECDGEVAEDSEISKSECDDLNKELGEFCDCEYK